MTCRVQAVPPSVPDLSPTEVQDWMLCPSYWRWRYVERVLPKTVGKNEVQAWIGSAIHAGIATWVKEPMPDFTSTILEAAMGEFNQRATEAHRLGREVAIPKESEGKILPTLRKFIAQAPGWLRTACYGVEVPLGRARLDWIGRLDGDWLIVDFKTKKKRPYNLEAYQWENRRSWQFADYVERAHGHPDSPAYGGVVLKVQVQTIVLDEFEVITDTFTPSPIHTDEQTGVEVLMEGYGPGGLLLDVRPWRNRSRCRNWFGEDCPYLRACWDYDSDPQRMSVDYVKKENPT